MFDLLREDANDLFDDRGLFVGRQIPPNVETSLFE
jgi:hypothetical protein